MSVSPRRWCFKGRGRRVVAVVRAQAKGFGNILKPAAPKDLLRCAAAAAIAAARCALRAPYAVSTRVAAQRKGLRVNWRGERVAPCVGAPARSSPPTSTAAAAAAAAAPGRGREPIRPFPQSPKREVPPHIALPPYAVSGKLPGLAAGFEVHDEKVRARFGV
jgi:hypothetical protein